MIIGGRSCRSCQHVLKLNGLLFCTLNPPQVFSAFARDAAGNTVLDARGLPGLVPQATYPQVNPAFPCGQYKRSEANAATEIEEAAPPPAERIVLNS